MPALLVYTAVAIHYLLPFQQVTILLGQGEVGGYGARHVLRYGLPLTVVVLVVIVRGRSDLVAACRFAVKPYCAPLRR